MSEKINELPSPLPEELVTALHQAVARNLRTLDTLRNTVRQHVRAERDRGASLTQIERELGALVARAERDARRPSGSDSNGQLAAQVARWSKAFFQQEQ